MQKQAKIKRIAQKKQKDDTRRSKKETALIYIMFEQAKFCCVFFKIFVQKAVSREENKVPMILLDQKMYILIVVSFVALTLYIFFLFFVFSSHPGAKVLQQSGLAKRLSDDNILDRVEYSCHVVRVRGTCNVRINNLVRVMVLGLEQTLEVLRRLLV